MSYRLIIFLLLCFLLSQMIFASSYGECKYQVKVLKFINSSTDFKSTDALIRILTRKSNGFIDCQTNDELNLKGINIQGNNFKVRSYLIKKVQKNYNLKNEVTCDETKCSSEWYLNLMSTN